MPRTKYPPLIATGERPNGQTPPESMDTLDCMEYMHNESIIAAKRIGGKPKEGCKPIDYLNDARPKFTS